MFRPLYLSHTVVDIIGDKRVEKVIISKVDENKRPMKGTEVEFECDTLLLSVGLIPENELSDKVGIELDRRTNGLVVHVHDLVDFVTEEAKHAGKSAAKYLKNILKKENYINIKNGNAINYTVPQRISIEDIDEKLTIFMRVNNVYKNKVLVVKSGEKEVARLKKRHLSKKLLNNIEEDLIISLEDGE